METKNYKKQAIILYIISWILCFGLLCLFISIGYSRYVANAGDTMVDFEQKFGSLAAEYVGRLKTIVITAFIGLLPMLILSIIVKDKIKPTVWMLDIILANLLVDSWLMYVVFGIWLVDNYILRPLAKKRQVQYQINKEIDKRG